MVVMKNMTTNFTHSHAEGKILQLQDRIEELEDKLQMTQESAAAAASVDGTSNGEEDNDNNNAKSKNSIIEGRLYPANYYQDIHRMYVIHLRMRNIVKQFSR